MARPLLWLALSCASLTLAAGIRLELTHVDARDNCTVGERMHRATERAHRRLASAGGVTAPVRWAETQYVAEYLIGEPTQKVEAIIDSASNLVWTQCATCAAADSCFDQTLPRYDPSASRTAALVPCNGIACALGNEAQCTRDGKTCAVVGAYSGGVVAGVLATEVFTFGNESATLAFGCVNVNRLASPGAFHGASGYIGLGRGGLSLVSQLEDTKFSYCFAPYFLDAVNASHLFVGPSAGLVADQPATAVPLVKSPGDFPFSTLYYVPLDGVSVGSARLDVPATAFELREVETGSWAGTYVDSGFPLTVLADVAYQALRTELARQLRASLVPPPSDTRLDLCIASDNLSLVPPVVLHFGDAGDVEVPTENYWAPLDTTLACMLVFSSAHPNGTLASNGTTVIGNYMQQNMHLLYDLGAGVLSFQKADCSLM